MSRAGATLCVGVGARTIQTLRAPRAVVATRISVVDMASALLRRQLAHRIALPRRCLFFSTSSVLAQAAPESQSSSTTTTPPAGAGGKNVFNRHIAEELQGVSASEILAESGTRKDAQMRHFTGEGYVVVFFGLTGGESGLMIVSPPLPPTPVNFGCAGFGKVLSRAFTLIVILYSSPQHPAAHGVLRLILELNGEEILRADPVRACPELSIVDG